MMKHAVCMLFLLAGCADMGGGGSSASPSGVQGEINCRRAPAVIGMEPGTLSPQADRGMERRSAC